MGKWRVYMTYVRDIPYYSVARPKEKYFENGCCVTIMEYAPDANNIKDKEKAIALRDRLNQGE